MTIAAYLDATSEHLQHDLDEPVDLMRALAGKPVWRWAFDALKDCGAFEPVYVASSIPTILEEAKRRGAIALHPDHDAQPDARPLLRVDVGAVMLRPADLAKFLDEAGEGGVIFEASSGSSSLPPALAIDSDQEDDVPREINLADRIEAGRLLFNDWDLLESLVRRHGHLSSDRKPIRLLVSDVDGVMTDAGFYYDREGQSLKKFSTRDGMGIVLVRDRIEFGIITGEASGFAEIRFGNLKINRIKTGTLDKLPVLDEWRREMGLEWEEVAYVGDDLPDIPCMRQAGISACPSDAEQEVKAIADFVSSRRGGQGAVRDFINHLLSHNLVAPQKAAP